MKNIIIIIGTIMLGVIIVNTMILGDGAGSLKTMAGDMVEKGGSMVRSIGVESEYVTYLKELLVIFGMMILGLLIFEMIVNGENNLQAMMENTLRGLL